MKKIITIVLSIALIATMFCACGSKEEEQTTQPTTENTTEVSTEASTEDNSDSSDESNGIASFDVDVNSMTQAFTWNTYQYGTMNIEDFDLSGLETEFEGTSIEVAELQQLQTDLYTDLAKEFKAEGINVSVVGSTGELALDSTILFGGDSADLTDEGKAFLDKFIKAYTTIVFNDKYANFVEKTMVEGHIAPIDGVTYEGGLPLSQKRAENVLNYCLTVNTGVDNSTLKKSFEAVGLSNKYPVKNEDGTNNLDQSRRVSFRFILNSQK